MTHLPISDWRRLGFNSVDFIQVSRTAGKLRGALGASRPRDGMT